MNPTEIFSHHIVIENKLLFGNVNLYTIIFMILIFMSATFPKTYNILEQIF